MLFLIKNNSNFVRDIDMKRILFILFLSFTAFTVQAQNKGGISASTSVKEKTITISPNPAVSDVQVSIEGNEFGVKAISIYSIIGSEVFSQSYTQSPTQTIGLNVRNLKKGKYMVRVTFEDGSSEVATLIKQ